VDFFLFPEKIQKVLIPCLIAYATGTLLAAAFLGMIPHALEHEPSKQILGTVLIGIVIFFLLEKLIIWRHCHDEMCEVHRTPGPMIIIGDAFHNLADGVVIAASFLISIPIGVAAGLSVIAHETPQEVGDFGILVHNGYSKNKALRLNLLSSLISIPGALIAYFALDSVRSFIPYVLAISAASFIYISLSDLTPELHKDVGFWTSLRQFILILAGILTIAIFLHH